MNAQQIAEGALAALHASHRDACWLHAAALDAARPQVFDHQRFGAAMDLAAKAAGLRDALAERIALLEPEVGRLVAECSDDRERAVH